MRNAYGSRNNDAFREKREIRGERDSRETRGEQNSRAERNAQDNREERNAHENREERGERELIAGRNAVLEALRAERSLNKVFIQKDSAGGSVHEIFSLAKTRGIPVHQVEKPWLDKLAQGAHQGVAAFVSAREYYGVPDILEYAAERSEKPLIVIANGIFDPNNLGALIRSAEAAGAHGVVIPKRNAAGLTEAVAKASAGAIEYMRVARVSNIADTLKTLKKQGVWIAGADAGAGQLYTECDYTDGTALVIGGESAGLGKLVRETCDFTVRLPMRGRITSLNASASASILLYEALRQRGQIK